MGKTAKEPKGGDRVSALLAQAWSLVFSLQSGLVLLAVVTGASIVGTLLPPPSPDVSQLEHAQRVIYYSWWFQALLLLLAANMLLATWRNVVTRVLPSHRPRFQKIPDFYRATAPGASLTAIDAATLDAALRAARFCVRRDGPYGYAVRGQLGRWGAPLAHLGVAIVLLAGFASQWTAREGRVNLLEGEQTDRMLLTGGDPPRWWPLGFTLRCEDFDTAFFPKTRIPSRFISTVTVLEPGLPPRTGKVEANRSLVADGWKLHQTDCQEEPGGRRYRLAVAGEGLPTTVTLELSPGQRRPLPRAEGLTVALREASPLNWRILRGDRPVQQGVLGEGLVAPLTLRARRFEPDFVIGPDRKAGSRSRELNNPALEVALLEGERPIDTQWLFAREDLKGMMHGGQGPYALDLTAIEGEATARVFTVSVKDRRNGAFVGQVRLTEGGEAELASTQPQADMVETSGPWRVRLVETVPLYRTTLTLARNAAVPAVYFGCAVMLVGLLLAFFIRRCELFSWHDAAREVMHLAAVYRHPRESFDPATRAVLNRLRAVSTPSPPTE